MKSKMIVPLMVLAAMVSLSMMAIVQAADDISASTYDLSTIMTFNDVDSSHENFDAIYFLQNTGVIQGYDVGGGDAEYRPDNNINRAEFLKIILEGTGMALNEDYETCFPDLIEDAWYETYICQAKEMGVVEGYPDKTFKPEQEINEAESLKILGEVMDWEMDTIDGELWYEPYFNYAYGKNIIPVEDVSAIMTRGDIAEMIFRNEEVEVLDIEKYSEDSISELFIVYGIPTYDIYILGSSNDNTDTTTDADVELVAYVSEDGPASANGEDEITIYVHLLDSDGNYVEDHELEGAIATPHDITRYDFDYIGDGMYELNLSSYDAGTFGLYVKDKSTGNIFTTEVTFNAGEPSYIDVINVEYPYETEDHYAYVYASLHDEYGNILTLSDGYALWFETDFGEFAARQYDAETNTWYAALTADSFGDATIAITEFGDMSINESVTVGFNMVYIDVPEAVSEGETFEVPVYINYAGYDSLAAYDLRITYNSGYTTFLEASDPVSADEFDAPSVDVQGNEILIYQSTNSVPAEDEDKIIQVANLVFQGAVVGGGAIYVNDGEITTGDEENVEADLPAAPEEAGQDINVKTTKLICIDVYTLEGSDESTYLDASFDVNYAEEIFNAAAENCNCPHYVNFTFFHQEIARDVWQGITEFSGMDFGGEDDVLEEDEIEDIALTLGAIDGCLQVFYIPQLEVDDETADADPNGYTIGWSDMNPTEYIVVDNSRDADDNLTLAHELLHMMSGNNVLDGHNPDATPQEQNDSINQGAEQPGNLMNYDDTGEGITQNQCNLVEWNDYQDQP